MQAAGKGPTQSRKGKCQCAGVEGGPVPGEQERQPLWVELTRIAQRDGTELGSPRTWVKALGGNRFSTQNQRVLSIVSLCSRAKVDYREQIGAGDKPQWRLAEEGRRGAERKGQLRVYFGNGAGVRRHPDVEGAGKGAVRGAALLLARTARVAGVEGP